MKRTTKEFIAGTTAGAVGKVVEFPMDTAKVLMQTQDASNPKYSSGLHCLRKVMKKHGPLGLYRGIAAPLVGATAEISTLMTTYGAVKRLLGEVPGEKPPVWTRVGAAASAGVAVSLVLTPVELIKCRLQVDKKQYTGTFDCIAKTVRSKGLPGLFRGNASTMMREIPGNVAWFGAYELVCDCFREKQGCETEALHPSVYILAGASAGVCYWTAFYPADVVKSCIQTGRGLETLPQRAGELRARPPEFWEVLRHVARTEGMAGLYKGWGITVARAAPANAAVFYAYEMAMQALGAGEAEGAPQDVDRGAGGAEQPTTAEHARLDFRSGAPEQHHLSLVPQSNVALCQE